ncbi:MULTISPECIES: pyridoxamine 5'-phosphate oxidase family protein [Streptomyces]|uniref:FMN-binding pyridoxamine 5'-phosphate oxidase-like protein n=1 Tax=Streptomyces griseus TaxID=1911 RepID=A0A380MSB7_STRGR|nr:pyridoxamine 5'-phosphate oxidase family protein [Streptomyces griseus]SUO94793.1 FMN-binding pyridoxamine 5'-phosphate oxidase-like protein [Streptomyces griseus]
MSSFDVHDFLSRPLVARVATAGPTVRPVWFLWEENAFWWLTGAYARLERRLAEDPTVALVVDTCDLATGQVLSVTCRGTAEVVALDRSRAVRKLTRHLGPEETWPARFTASLDDPAARLVRCVPERPPVVRDLSW